MYGILLSLILVWILLLNSSCQTRKEYSTEKTQTYINEKIESMLSEIKTDYLDVIIKSSLAGDAIIKEKVFDMDRPPDSITGQYPVKIEREIELDFRKNDSIYIKQDKESKIEKKEDISKHTVVNTDIDKKKEVNANSWINKIKNVLVTCLILILLLFLSKYYKKKKS